VNIYCILSQTARLNCDTFTRVKGQPLARDRPRARDEPSLKGDTPGQPQIKLPLLMAFALRDDDRIVCPRQFRAPLVSWVVLTRTQKQNRHPFLSVQRGLRTRFPKGRPPCPAPAGSPPSTAIPPSTAGAAHPLSKRASALSRPSGKPALYCLRRDRPSHLSGESGN